MSNVAVIEPRAKSVLFDMADRYGMEPVAFEATLRATVVPNNCSREQFAAFLLVAKEYKLNPILKEIYAFPSKGGIQPIVGVDGWANLINSHPAFDGMDFTDHLSDKGELVSITCRMHRKDRTHPVTATEYLAECRRATEPWQKWPRRMLRHKAMIQAARYAFSFAGIVDPDEVERFAADLAHDVTPSLSDRLAAAKAPGNATVDGFSPQHVISEIDGAPQTNSSPEKPTPAEPAADTPASDVSPSASDAGNNSAEQEPPAALAPNTQAVGAGGGDDAPSLSPPTISLPDGWAIEYAAALRRAQKPDSLKKLAKQFWDARGGWVAHAKSPDGETAKAIFAAFENHFGDKAAIEELLRELI